LEIQTQEEFDEYMNCKKCGNHLKYYDAGFDLESKIIILKVRCAEHKGTRPFSNQNFRHLHRLGIITDQLFNEVNRKYIQAKRNRRTHRSDYSRLKNDVATLKRESEHKKEEQAALQIIACCGLCLGLIIILIAMMVASWA